jgi:reductase EvaE/reductase VcaE
VIYLSSSNISGAQNEIIINENTFDNLNSEWSASKKMSEMLFHLSKHKGFKCVSLRLPNVYGVASNPATFNRMSINKMIETAISKKKVTLYSNHKLKRDFMHISDVTDSIFAAAKCFDLLDQREFYYVGSESLNSYDDLAEILKEILYEKDIFISKLYDFDKQVTAIEMRAGSIDSSLFRDITNWKSKYKLKDGLLKAINDNYSMNI